MKTFHLSLVLGAIFLSALLVRAQAPMSECGGNSGVDFQIVTDKLVYPPGSMMRVKFLVTNTQETPLYLNRGVSYCTSPLGFYWLTLLDNRDKQVPISGCSADVLMEKIDAVEMFTDPKSGIALETSSIYGSQAAFELPAKKGTYRLKAELFPGGFSEKQLQVLAEKHMRVLQSLQCKIPAPIVTITVR